MKRRAFTLVEVTLAMGIAAFSLVALLGLLPLALTNNKSSSEQTAAAGILATLVTNLRAAQINGQYGVLCPVYGISMLMVPPNPNYGATLYLHDDGTLAGQPNKAADLSTHPRYRLTVQMYPPATGDGRDARQATVVRLTINWPAIAEANNYTPPPSYSNSLEVVTTLDRN